MQPRMIIKRRSPLVKGTLQTAAIKPLGKLLFHLRATLKPVRMKLYTNTADFLPLRVGHAPHSTVGTWIRCSNSGLLPPAPTSPEQINADLIVQPDTTDLFVVSPPLDRGNQSVQRLPGGNSFRE